MISDAVMQADASAIPNSADCPIARLSFVADRDGKALPKPERGQWERCFWNVRPSGHYAKDCATGRALALEFLAYEAEDEGGPGALQLIVKDMPRDLTGIEIGFLSTVGRAAGASVRWAREEGSRNG